MARGLRRQTDGKRGVGYNSSYICRKNYTRPYSFGDPFLFDSLLSLAQAKKEKKAKKGGIGKK
jgi:hypothetical protein